MRYLAEPALPVPGHDAAAAPAVERLGILISAGQISNLLTKGHDAFHAEKAAVKQAGLETARWISVDDTGARHLGINGVTTQIGDDRFTSFDTVASKSRLMFLMTLRGAFQDYVINAGRPALPA